MGTTSIFQRKLDLVYVVYFLLHVGISLVIDATIAIPRDYLFEIQKYMGDFHIEQNNDLLVASRPKWLQAFVWVEILFQVPFFIGAAYGLIKDCKKTYLWILIYCVEAAITTLGCLVEVYYISGVTEAQRVSLLAMYLPTCLIPFAMGVDFWKRIVRWIPSEDSDKKNK